jgi:hypothetical protein
MPNGGTLAFEGRSPRRAPRVELLVAGTPALVSAPPNNMSKIFNLYFTTKEKGTGIRPFPWFIASFKMHDGRRSRRYSQHQGAGNDVRAVLGPPRASGI